MAVGDPDGVTVGDVVGEELGATVGDTDGDSVGDVVGEAVGGRVQPLQENAHSCNQNGCDRQRPLW